MKKIIQIATARWCPDARPDTDGSYPSCWVITDTRGEVHWFFVDLEDYILTEGQLLGLEFPGSTPLGYRWILSRVL